MTFWDHLDELRSVLLRLVAVMLVLTVGLFFLKEQLFDIVLAPSQSSFALYRFMCHLSEITSIASLCPADFSATLINTELTGQFLAHMRIAFYAAIIVGAPYIIWQIFVFVGPALYPNEKNKVKTALVAGHVLFMCGVLLNYFLIFPLSFRFLALYEVDSAVENLIQLKSYIDTMMMLTLMMGIVFEIPLVCIMLSKIRIITAKMMTAYRRHAILAIVIVAAIITPTTDIFTLLLVGFPIYTLYEISVILVRIIERKRERE